MKTKQKINDRISAIVLGISIIALLFGALFSLAAEDRKKSDIENRSLMQFISPTTEKVATGEWMSEFENYSKDQFFERDFLCTSRFLFLDLLGNIERNGYIKGKDNTVLAVPNEQSGFTIDEESRKDYIINSLTKLKRACDKAGAKMISLQVPHKNVFFENCCPWPYYGNLEADKKRQEEFDRLLEKNGIEYIDVSDMLLDTLADQYIYFRTDNHWTFLGAYYTYIEVLRYINEKYGENLYYPQWEDCDYFHHDQYYGSYLASFGNSGIIRPDTIEYIIPKDYPKYTRYDNGKKSKRPIINKEGINYTSIFMGNNYANTVVKTNRKELPSILILGYSYTNAMETMAAYSFNEMHSIDYRYYEGNISDYIKNNHFDYVLVIRNDFYRGSKNKAVIK